MSLIKMQLSRCRHPGLQWILSLTPGSGLCGDSHRWSQATKRCWDQSVLYPSRATILTSGYWPWLSEDGLLLVAAWHAALP